jgi:hypothetical protein
VIEAWEWYRDIRLRVKKHVATTNDRLQQPTTEMEKMLGKKDIDHAELWQRWRDEGGDGIVALGRPAFKGIVAGMNDHVLGNEMNEKSSVPLPPIGFIPYTIPKSWHRVVGFFNDRFPVRV